MDADKIVTYQATPCDAAGGDVVTGRPVTAQQSGLSPCDTVIAAIVTPADKIAYTRVARDWAAKLLGSRQTLAPAAEFHQYVSAERAGELATLARDLAGHALRDYQRRARLDAPDPAVTLDGLAASLLSEVLAASLEQTRIDQAALSLLLPPDQPEPSDVCCAAAPVSLRLPPPAEPLVTEHTIDVVFRGARRKVTCRRPAGV